MSEEFLLFKVLDKNMESCHGGCLKWELGKTETVQGEIILCENGLHLTTNPKVWITFRSDRVFVAATDKIYDCDENKAVCRSVTLLREMSKEDLEKYDAEHKLIYKEYRAKLKTIKNEYEAKNKPIYEEYKTKIKLINKEYLVKRKIIDEEYEAKRKIIDEEYEAKRKPIDEEYKTKNKPIYEEYEAKRKIIDEEYEAKRKPIDEEYEAKNKPIYEEYEAKRKPISINYLVKVTEVLRGYINAETITKNCGGQEL